MKKVKYIILIFLLMISLSSVIVFGNEDNGEVESAEVVQEAADSPKILYVKAKVIEAGDVITQTVGNVKDVTQEIKLQVLDEGEYKDKEFVTVYSMTYDNEGKNLAYKLEIGDVVTATLEISTDGSSNVEINGISRTGYLVAIVLIFLLSILIIGGKNGIKSVISLIITALAIWFILLNLIFEGVNAIIASIITSIVIIMFTLIIISGINKRTFTAIIGTTAGVIISGIIALIFSKMAEVTGASEDVIQLSLSLQNITFNLKDLIFASVLISSLGACMDVGMSIARNLDEIKNKTQDLKWNILFLDGMKQGKELIGTMTNTLLLAYIGGILKVIILLIACNIDFINLINREVITENIILALSGSLGMLYTIPVTSITYALLNRKKTIYKTTSENIIDGKRSLKL